MSQLTMKKLDSRSILGVRVDAVDSDTALELMEEFIGSGGPHIVVTADASSVVLSQRDQELRRIINESDLVTPDGAGILWAAARLDARLPERVSGVDLVGSLCESAAKSGWSVFLLGAAPGVAEEAAKKLVEQHPGLKIAGTHHGYFEPEQSEEIVRLIHGSKPDILFVALGIPRQEKWIARHMAELDVPVSMGVGGTFDVLSGRIKRAPEWMQKHGLEWIYRLMSDPRKIRKVSCLPRFVLMVLRAPRGAKRAC